MPTSRLDMPGMFPRRASNAVRTFSAWSRRSSGEVPRTRHMTTCLIMRATLDRASAENHQDVTLSTRPRSLQSTRGQLLFPNQRIRKYLAEGGRIRSPSVDRPEIEAHAWSGQRVRGASTSSLRAGGLAPDGDRDHA